MMIESGEKILRYVERFLFFKHFFELHDSYVAGVCAYDEQLLSVSRIGLR